MDKREQRKKRAVALTGLGLFVVFTVVICWFVGRPMIQFVSQPDQFREWVDTHGVWGRLAFLGMMVFQVIIAIVPGEPLEIGAGYAFGVIEGTVLCLLGTLIGGVVIFLFVKKFGMRFVTLFVSEEKIHSLKFLQNTRRLHLVAFILFFIPGTPKDVLTYIVGLTPMKLPAWILITSVARIPSVVSSTIGGNALGTQEYQFAVIVFVATAVISGLGVLAYQKITKHHAEKEALRERNGGEDGKASGGSAV